MNSKKHTVLELFAGAGGLAIGLEAAGLSTVGLVEIDKHASETLKANRPDWKIFNMDIKDFNANLFDYIDFNSRVDVISGGFPCQPFSYTLATGDEHAFRDLCQVLPKVVSDVVASLSDSISKNTVLEELQETSSNTLASIYMMAFSKYAGFDNFDVIR